jgi:hypothetical protein
VLTLDLDCVIRHENRQANILALRAHSGGCRSLLDRP